jgi:hypothetical protein
MPAAELTRAEQVQIDLLRAASPVRRSQIAGRLSADVRRLAMRAICGAQPQLDEWQARVRFAEIHYGRDLAARLAADLRRRGLLVAS